MPDGASARSIGRTAKQNGSKSNEFGNSPAAERTWITLARLHSTNGDYSAHVSFRVRQTAALRRLELDELDARFYGLLPRRVFHVQVLRHGRLRGRFPDV